MSCRQFLTVMVILFSLTGCSTTFVYNNLPWLSQYWLDDYVDLNKQQASQFKQEIETLRRWHKTEALPQYQAQLKVIQQNVLVTNDPNDFLMWRQQLEGFWQALLLQAKDPLIELALTLTFEQRQQFIKNVTKKINQQQDEFAQLNQVSLIEKKRDRVTGNLKNWFGKLTTEQKLLVDQNVNTSGSMQGLWLEYKQRRLAAISELFLQPVIDEAVFRYRLADIIVNSDQFKPEQLLLLSSADKQLNADFLHQIVGTLTTKQQQQLLKEIDKWSRDINSIMNEVD